MIYPLSDQIAAFLSSITDAETGEIFDYVTEDMIKDALAEIQMDFDDKIVELRNAYIDATAVAKALKDEKLKLEKRQSTEEKNAERIKGFIAYLLNGEKFQKGTCKIGWRKSEELVCDEDFVEWAKEHADDYLKYTEPTPKKKEIMTAIKGGVVFDHAYIRQKNNIQVK